MIDNPVLDHNFMVNILRILILFFAIAGFIVPLLQRLRLPSPLAYLLCGLTIGPFGLGLFTDQYEWLDYVVIEEMTTVNILGEFGIIALMFMIGLELSINRLKEMRTYVLGLGSLQILLTSAAITGIALFFDNSTASAIVIGAAFALSSTALVMDYFEKHNLLNQSVGIFSFSILLMQDLAVIPILLFVGVLAGTQLEMAAYSIFTTLFLGLLLFSIVYIIGRIALNALLRFLSTSTNPEWLSSFTVFILLTLAFGTQAIGLSPALGAFFAGLIIAKTDFRHEVKVIISPLKSLLMGIFFLSVGMIIDMREVLLNPYLISISVLGIFFVKVAILFPLMKLFQISKAASLKGSLYLSQPGEFTLLILSVSYYAGILPTGDFQFFLLVTSIAMMITPFIIHNTNTISEKFLNVVSAYEPQKNHSEINSHIIIAGFGRVGHMLGDILTRQSVPFVAIDYNAERVYDLKKMGYPVIYGDARKPDLWKSISKQTPRIAVVTIDRQDHTLDILKSIRKQWPLIHVIMRSKDVCDIHEMYDQGANFVVPETLESTLRIARISMKEVGFDVEEIDQIIEGMWEQVSVYEKNITDSSP